jgi:hypothetical protein
MPPSSSIVDLRRFLQERFPKAPAISPACFSTGVAALDNAIGGGFPKNAITELISPRPSAGSASLIHELVRAAPANRHFVALVDGSDSFDPESSGNKCLRHLLWVRCRQGLEAIKVTDLLLRDGNFPLVMVDLVLNRPPELRKIPQTTWYRMQRLVEAVPTACLVLTGQSMVASAQVKIVLENCWTLRSLENEAAISQLRFRIRRSHFKSEISNQQSAIS